MEPLTIQVVIDAISPAALAEFWAVALGYRLDDPPPGFDTWEAALEASGLPRERWDDASAIVPTKQPGGPRIFFQKVPEPKEVKNRVHLDVRVPLSIQNKDERWNAVRTHAGALTQHGATLIDERTGQWGERWIVLADPEGNEFCVS